MHWDYVGKKIMLDKLIAKFDKLPPGSTGTCIGIDPLGNLIMDWDNGVCLNLVPDVDKFHIVQVP